MKKYSKEVLDLFYGSDDEDNFEEENESNEFLKEDGILNKVSERLNKEDIFGLEGNSEGYGEWNFGCKLKDGDYIIIKDELFLDLGIDGLLNEDIVYNKIKEYLENYNK